MIAGLFDVVGGNVIRGIASLASITVVVATGGFHPR
jgi:hypothetical protein